MARFRNELVKDLWVLAMKFLENLQEEHIGFNISKQISRR